MRVAEARFEVVEISWERALLNFSIDTDYQGSPEFFLERIDSIKLERCKDIRLVSSEQSILLKVVSITESDRGIRYGFHCNTAAFHGRSFLENGKWRIAVRSAKDNEDRNICLTDTKLAYRFDDLSRVFRYGKELYAYTVSFTTYTIEDKELAFLMESFFMKTNSDWKKRHYVEEARTPKGKVKRVAMTAAIWGMRLFYQVAEHLSPKKGNRILLMSETHDYLWGNLKAIDENLRAMGLDKTYHISHSFRQAAGKSQSIGSWIRLIWLLARQDVVFVDDYAPSLGFLNLNSRTRLVQVWHAGLGFKSVGYCRFGKDGSPYPAESCHKKYDYALSCSGQMVEVFAEVFGIEEEVLLPTGMPRLDGFLDPVRIEEIRNRLYGEYPMLKGKKVIQFAPTYRGTGQQSAYYDYSWLDLKQIYEYCGDDKVFLIKMHPFIKKLIDIPEAYADRIIEFSFYPNINDLYYITDLLITDYSSNYFDYSLLKRPCLFFTPDRELYEISRGVHRGVKEGAPGKVCDTFEEMMEALWKEDFEVWKIEQFVLENFGEYDGKATERVIDQLLKHQEA